MAIRPCAPTSTDMSLCPHPILLQNPDPPYILPRPHWAKAEGVAFPYCPLSPRQTAWRPYLTPKGLLRQLFSHTSWGREKGAYKQGLKGARGPRVGPKE